MPPDSKARTPPTFIDFSLLQTPASYPSMHPNGFTSYMPLSCVPSRLPSVTALAWTLALLTWPVILLAFLSSCLLSDVFHPVP